jgi:DNA polymerase/3'-5' exonuclease PolX
MEPIVNESNRLLFQEFVSIAKQYSTIGEQYRSKALEKSSKVIANYPDEITSGCDLRGIPGIGVGTISRINIFLKDGCLKIQNHEYTRAAKRARDNDLQEVQVPPPMNIDVLVPGKFKYAKIIVFKKEYSLVKETEDYYYFA